MKRCSMSLNIREIQIRITVRHHLTHARMAVINKSTSYIVLTTLIFKIIMTNDNMTRWVIRQSMEVDITEESTNKIGVENIVKVSTNLYLYSADGSMDMYWHYQIVYMYIYIYIYTHYIYIHTHTLYIYTHTHYIYIHTHYIYIHTHTIYYIYQIVHIYTQYTIYIYTQYTRTHSHLSLIHISEPTRLSW